MQIMLMIFKVTDIFSFVLDNDTQLNDDLIHRQVPMGGKNAEVGRSTSLYTDTAHAYHVQHFPD